MQALFGRSNSPKENPVQNTNVLLNKLNLTGNVLKNNETFATKGSPKGTNLQTAKLQDQIKQLQQEQLLLQKKIPNIYQNVFNEPKYLNKSPNTTNITNKANKDLTTNDNQAGIFTSKINFAENSGSPKNQMASNNNKNNFIFQDKNSKMVSNNQDKGKAFDGAQAQNQSNLFQSLLKKK